MTIVSRDEVILAIDLGCTKSIVALVDCDGREIVSRTVDTQAARGGDDYVDRVAGIVDGLRDAGNVRAANIAAVSAGVPGPLDPNEGVIHDPPQLPWGDHPLGARLRERLGVDRIVLENDCTAGGIGEHRDGAGRGASSMAYFGIGTGIGGCVIIDDSVVSGASGDAGELGHLVVWLDGPLCGCGNRGCIEGIASGSGLARRAQDALRAGEADAKGALASSAGSIEDVDGAAVGAAAAAGDPFANRLLRDGERAVAAACASLMSALSPETIVLGGGMPVRYGASYVKRIDAQARSMAFGPNADATRIVPAQLGERSVLRGAIALAVEAVHA